jgi:hypothetical protein
MSKGASAEDDERMKRNGWSEMTVRLASTRVRMLWCIAGTPVYQVGSNSASQSKNRVASYPVARTTLAPALSEGRSAPTRP